MNCILRTYTDYAVLENHNHSAGYYCNANVLTPAEAERLAKELQNFVTQHKAWRAKQKAMNPKPAEAKAKQ